MYKLKLIRGRSYDGYGVKVSNLQPFIIVENKEKTNQLLGTKRFELVNVSEAKNEINSSAPPSINSDLVNEQWTVPQLREYAHENGIDLTGLQVKADIIAKIQEVITEDDNVLEYGEVE